MFRLEGMYAPGNECAHVLPPAGFVLTLKPDVFRFNRTLPYYPPDPNIRPNEGDIVCPPERVSYPRHHNNMPMAGIDARTSSDVYRFHKVRKSDACDPCHGDISAPCKMKLCRPHIHLPHYPPSKPGRHFDFRYPAGQTACNAAAHRHGHVPETCRRTYPETQDIPDQTPRSCCDISGYGDTGSYADTRSVPYDAVPVEQVGGSSEFRYDPPFSPVNNGGISNASMYNNASSPAYGPSGDYESYNQPRACLKNSSNISDVPTAAYRNKTSACPNCKQSYFQTNYVCRPMFDRTYLLDCPRQDGPPPDTYTFL